MKLILDDQNLIVGFSVVGNLEDATDFNGAIPEGFFEAFVPNKFILKDEMIILNEQYHEPILDIPSVDGVDVVKGISDLTKQIALRDLKQSQTDAMLLKQIAELSKEN
ncbi:DUF2977 domain-containing protein [Weissella paramesenteroides]|uniref:DUF2977 domain-containing protein n=1 Tax=Weissella paramesenteroides TaxID=1249 RepID=UPI003F215B0D